MLAEQFAAAAAAARNTAAVDQISRLTWRAHAEGHILDAEAEAISEALQGRRAAFATKKAHQAVSWTKTALARRRPAPRSPDRQASLERRRRQAASGSMPPALASRFTTGELAALAVIARQCQRMGACSLPIDAIAALAGVSRTTVQNALRAAKAQGIVLAKERRRRGLRSLTNIISIISKEWMAWLKFGERIGFRKLSATDNCFYLMEDNGEKSTKNRDATWRGEARSGIILKNTTRMEEV
jgi:Bacterial regulatory proteins, gntR family